MNALKPMNPEVIEILYRQHLQFRAFLTKKLGDATLAEDILQECLVKAAQNSGQLEDHESIIAWFYRILRNALSDHFRGLGADARKNIGMLEEMKTHQEDRSIPKEHADPELCACFIGLLDAVRPAYAELLRRIDLGGEPADSVANDLGITPANLHVRLHRARQALKKSLELSCGTCAEHGCLDCQCER